MLCFARNFDFDLIYNKDSFQNNLWGNGLRMYYASNNRFFCPIHSLATYFWESVLILKNVMAADVISDELKPRYL